MNSVELNGFEEFSDILQVFDYSHNFLCCVTQSRSNFVARFLCAEEFIGGKERKGLNESKTYRRGPYLQILKVECDVK